MDDIKNMVCEPIAEYCNATKPRFKSLFEYSTAGTSPEDIRVVELFAGVGGFRIGLERASGRYRTVWNNQWEPSTKKQDASIVYCRKFGLAGHSNEDIATVPSEEIPVHDLLVGGFPCQDYSVATTLKRSGGIEGKKGVLWWQIYRILNESAKRPDYLFFENRGRRTPFHISIGRDVCRKDEPAMSGIDRFSILTAPYYKYYQQTDKRRPAMAKELRMHLYHHQAAQTGEIARFAVISWGATYGYL